MSVFVDTSALFAVLDRDDENHGPADKIWRKLVLGKQALTTTSYVLVEATALVQNRLGIPFVRVLHDDVLPMIDVHWVSEAEHRAGIASLLIAGRAELSLVDCVSFEVMRQRGIAAAFVFDRHFRQRGFRVVS